MTEKNSKRSIINREWFAIDNAGKIFPGQNSAKWSNAFRLTFSMNETIDPALMQRALERVLPRFPCYAVKLRHGFFWYYFEKNEKSAPEVKKDINNICYRFKYSENDRFLFRVFYHEKKISVEFFHAISDAYGCSRLMSTMVAEYLRLKGYDIPCGGAVLDINQSASESELRDPFLHYCSSKVKAPRPKMNVYHFKAKKLPMHTVNLTIGYLPVDKLLQEARKYNSTLTEYVAATLVYIHYKVQKEKERRQKDISAQIPVNLRRTYNSDTLRNFSMCYCYRMNPNMGEYTFEEILRQLSLYLRFINNEKQLNAMMAANTSIEKNPILRALPLFIKKAGMSISFMITGERSTSTAFSNFGKLDVPPEMAAHIEKAALFMGPGLLNGARVGGISFGNTMALAFSNCYEDRTIEREFFRELVKRGIPVKIEANS